MNIPHQHGFKDSDLLLTILIPEYPTRIQVSKAARPKYYKKGRERAPTKFQPHPQYDNAGYLIDPDTNERVLKNPSGVGKPRYKPISGNRMSSYRNEYGKSMVVKGIKDYYKKFLYNYDPITIFPLRITWDLFTTVTATNYDLSNFWFYYKYFEDCLRDPRELPDGTTLPPIIPDDSIKYITQPGNSPLLHPIDDFNNRGFVFRIYLDTRKQIINHKVWRST